MIITSATRRTTAPSRLPRLQGSTPRTPSALRPWTSTHGSPRPRPRPSVGLCILVRSAPPRSSTDADDFELPGPNPSAAAPIGPITFSGEEGPETSFAPPDEPATATVLHSLDVEALEELRDQDPVSATTLDLELRVEKESSGAAVRRWPLPPRPKTPFNEAILLQAFGWESCNDGRGWYNVLTEQVEDVAAAGFTHAWLPPPSKSVDKRGYLPSLLYDLDNSKYGNMQQLIALNTKLKEHGVAPICDIVVNHRCADKRDGSGKWNTYGDYERHPFGRASVAWGPEAIASDSSSQQFGGQGANDTGAAYAAAPDLDHTNAKVRAGVMDWMAYLIEDIGFEGWRFDYVKGYGPEFTYEYTRETLGEDREIFSIAEYWVDSRWSNSYLDPNQDEACGVLCRWINRSNKLCAAFDFVLKGQLNEALKGEGQLHRLQRPDGRACGLVGWWPRRAVLFVDNHDTGSSQRHWPCPDDKVEASYAYILLHQGVPCVLHEHLFSWGTQLGDAIRALVRVRRAAGITAVSRLHIKCARHDLYVHEITGERGIVVLKLGPALDMGDLKPSREQGYRRVGSGHWWAAWSNAPEEAEAQGKAQAGDAGGAGESESDSEGNASGKGNGNGDGHGAEKVPVESAPSSEVKA